MIAWPDEIRKRVLRDSTWDFASGTVADETRCGRRRVRPALQLQPDGFTVSMNMTHDEYMVFKYWYKVSLRKGALTFAYPQIDAINGGNKEYRFVPSTKPAFDNPGGKIVHVSMQWEEA